MKGWMECDSEVGGYMRETEREREREREREGGGRYRRRQDEKL